MKIFKGVLIAFYALIVIGSIQNYSARYNGQEVFSLIGILDNFVVSAILPLIIYGVGLLIRKYLFKKSDVDVVSTPEAISVSTPDKPESEKPIRVWQVLLPVVLVLLLISLMLNLFGQDEPMPDAAPSTSTAPVYDDAWIPTGFSGYPEDDNVAWRWGTSSETNCTYNSSSCWTVLVITRDGCPSGIYSELAILDRSEVQVDFTNDSTTRVLPKTKVKLTFDTFNEEASTARVSEISCR